MIAGFLIGIASIAVSMVARSGLPAWLGIIAAMLVYSHDPKSGGMALFAGLAVWIGATGFSRLRR